MNFKNQLRIYLRSRAITSAQMAKRIQVPKSTIADWLSGAAPRDIGKVKKAADLFHVSLDHLLFGDGLIEEKKIQEFEDEIRAGIFEVVLRKVKK